MQQYEELIRVLNDLILINTRRIRELKYRIDNPESKSHEISLFTVMMNDAQQFKQQLTAAVAKKGGIVIKKINGNTGRIYNYWTELKSWLSQKKGLSVLEIVQFDTKATLKVYQDALFAIPNIPADTLDLIATQKACLRETCKTIEATLMKDYPLNKGSNYFKTKANYPI